MMMSTIRFLLILSLISCVKFTVNATKIVWDDYIDLCRFIPLEKRHPVATRCEKSPDIFVERRTYHQNEDPYWCISVKNLDGQYQNISILFNYSWEYRVVDFANKRISTRTTSFEDENPNLARYSMKQGYEDIVVYPISQRYPLQKILSIKIDGVEMCDQNRIHEEDQVFPSPTNNNLLRFYNKCLWIESRIHRDPNRCETMNEVIVEKLSYRGEKEFQCIIINKNLGNSSKTTRDELEIQFSSTWYIMTNDKRALKDKNSTRISPKYYLMANKTVFAVVPAKTHPNLSIVSLKLNNQESCSGPIETETTTLLCGQQKIQHIGLITFGTPTYHGQYPWHSALYELEEAGVLRYICGGSVITPTAVLTAAHCTTDQNGIKSPDIFRVQLGKFDLTVVNRDTKEFRVAEIVNHPNFERVFLENDISILKLKTVIEYSSFIQPICLSSASISENLYVIATVIGWGRLEGNQRASQLNQASMPIVSHEECRRSNRDFFSVFLTEKSFCAGYRNGTSVCTGDSGGGMVIKKENNYVLIGIVSLGVAAEDVCDITQHVLFTDVATHFTWINSVLNNISSDHIR